MVVIKLLYGIAEASTYWWATYFNHHRKKLRMATSTYDLCLLITSSKCFGIVDMQTDNTLILYNSKFNQLEENELNKAKFTAKLKEKLTMDNLLIFNGYILTKETNDSICLC
jgi:hypothetical protein